MVARKVLEEDATDRDLGEVGGWVGGWVDGGVGGWVVYLCLCLDVAFGGNALDEAREEVLDVWVA